MNFKKTCKSIVSFILGTGTMCSGFAFNNKANARLSETFYCELRWRAKGSESMQALFEFLLFVRDRVEENPAYTLGLAAAKAPAIIHLILSVLNGSTPDDKEMQNMTRELLESAILLTTSNRDTDDEVESELLQALDKCEKPMSDKSWRTATLRSIVTDLHDKRILTFKPISQRPGGLLTWVTRKKLNLPTQTCPQSQPVPPKDTTPPQPSPAVVENMQNLPREATKTSPDPTSPTETEGNPKA